MNKHNNSRYKCRNCQTDVTNYRRNGIRNCECGDFTAFAIEITEDNDDFTKISPNFPPPKRNAIAKDTSISNCDLVEEGFIFSDPRLMGFEDLQVSGRADTTRGLIFGFLRVNDRPDGWTSSEIMRALNWGPNTVRPRLFELFNGVKNGQGHKVKPCIDRVEVRMSRATGKKEYAYRLKTQLRGQKQ